MESPTSATRRRIPVVALTGHLGAGKTTVLNHLLRHGGGRVGVVVNDFGAVNIDAGLVSGQVGQVGSIAGGCICCLDDEGGLDDALEQLTHPRLALDGIVVEASGIAEPAALARMIRFSGVEAVRPGGVVEIVDTVHYDTTLDTTPHAPPPARFAAASLVVLNKTDLLDPAVREERLSWIGSRVRAVNSAAHLVRTSRGRVDPQLFFDAATVSTPDDELPIAELLRAAAAEAEPDQADQKPHAGHAGHAHSVTVEQPAPVAASALADLLDDPPTEAYRLKGLLAVATARGARGYVVQIVGRHVHVQRVRTTPPASTLVAIGVDLDETALRARLEAALRPVTASSADGVRRLERFCRLSE